MQKLTVRSTSPRNGMASIFTLTPVQRIMRMMMPASSVLKPFSARICWAKFALRLTWMRVYFAPVPSLSPRTFK